MSIYFL